MFYYIRFWPVDINEPETFLRSALQVGPPICYPLPGLPHVENWESMTQNHMG